MLLPARASRKRNRMVVLAKRDRTVDWFSRFAEEAAILLCVKAGSKAYAAFAVPRLSASNSGPDFLEHG
jgi:hypothetical protein